MDILIFKAGGREYGVDIREVSRVIRMREIVSVPEAADFIKGVLPLKGKVVPIIDLEKKMGLEPAGTGRRGRIIVSRVNSHFVGVVVDSVVEVISEAAGQISPPDELLKDAAYLSGVLRINKRLVLLVDLGRLLSPEERSGIQAVESKVEIKQREPK